MDGREERSVLFAPPMAMARIFQFCVVMPVLFIENDSTCVLHSYVVSIRVHPLPDEVVKLHNARGGDIGGEWGGMEIISLYDF